jgi:hypothetical protein
MSWIKIRTNLATDPAVAAIGIITKMHPRQVVGCLVSVWCWADPLTADGAIPHATERLVDDIAGKRGFASAMIGVQWLAVSTDGIKFPNWDRHHSQSAKARAGESERKRIARCSAHDVRKMSGQITEECPDQRRGEEIREENTTEAQASPVAAIQPEEPVIVFPPPLDTHAFRTAWAEWTDYRRERRIAALKPRSVIAQLAKLAEYGHDGAIDSIAQSIAQNYQGLFAPRQANGRPEKTAGWNTP